MTIISFIVSCLLPFHITGIAAKSQIVECINGPDKTINRIRIVFYNTENLFDTVDDSLTSDEEFLPGSALHWTYSRYKAKLEKVCKVIIATGGWNPPDVVGLGEIENSRVLQDLTDNTPLVKCEYRYIHKDSPDARGIDVALLYNPRTVRVIENIFIPVRFVVNAGKTTRDILYGKMIIRQRDTVHIFVNHWPSRSSGLLETEPARLYAAKILRLKIDSVFRTDPHQRVLVMGDFNDGPYDKSLIDGLQAKPVIESPLPGILYNLATDYEKSHKLGTHKYKGQWNMLDQIIVSGEMLIAGKGMKTSKECFSVFAPSFLLTEDAIYLGSEPFRTYKGPIYKGGYSDHLPVMVDLY
ncbi:MAG: endonuclease [Bacteroidales bacterium]|nr:endonuclease [Bacteroidales bacterium]